MAVVVKATATGLVDEPFEVNKRQVETAQAGDGYLAEMTFDYLMGNNGDFKSKKLYRGSALMSYFKGMWPLEEAVENRPNIKNITLHRVGTRRFRGKGTEESGSRHNRLAETF